MWQIGGELSLRDWWPDDSNDSKRPRFPLQKTECAAKNVADGLFRQFATVAAAENAKSAVFVGD